jgi:hypothetical protein
VRVPFPYVASEDRYSVLLLDRPTGKTVQRFVHTSDAGTFSASPEPQEASEYFETTREEAVELPYDTEARLRYVEPTM